MGLKHIFHLTQHYLSWVSAVIKCSGHLSNPPPPLFVHVVCTRPLILFTYLGIYKWCIKCTSNRFDRFKIIVSVVYFKWAQLYKTTTTVYTYKSKYDIFFTVFFFFFFWIGTNTTLYFKILCNSSLKIDKKLYRVKKYNVIIVLLSNISAVFCLKTIDKRKETDKKCWKNYTQTLTFNNMVQ